MTNLEAEIRDQRTLEKIATIFGFHHRIRPYQGVLKIVIEDSRITILGELPDEKLIDELVPAIRQAGVLSQIDNRVRVAA